MQTSRSAETKLAGSIRSVKKPYPMSKFTTRVSAEKDQFNRLAADMILEVTGQEEKELPKSLLSVDNEDLRSTGVYMLAGTTPGMIQVVERIEETYKSQQKALLARSELEGVTLTHGDVFAAITSSHRAIILDIMTDYPSEDNLARLATWSGGQTERHAVMITLSSRSRMLGPIRDRAANMAKALPSLHLHLFYGYKATSGNTTMFVLKFGSWPVGETQYRPRKVLETKMGKDGKKRFLVEWFGFPGEPTWEPEDSSALATLRQDGRWPVPPMRW